MKKLANILNSGQCALFSFVLVATLLLSCAKTEIAQNDAIANSSENTVPGEGDETGDPSNPEAPGADDPSQPGGPTVPTGPGADDYISPDHFNFIHLECNAKADAENPSTKLFGVEDAAMRVEPLDEDDTKTYLGEVINKKQLIYWTGGDKIKVYYAPGTSNWKKGTVKHGGDAESTIDIEVNEEDDYYYAFYPTCDTTVVTYAGGTYAGNTYAYGAFTVTVPTVQDGLFENCHMAVGKASKVAKSFAFSNVGSYLKITVNNTTATGITLQATNASDNIVGQFVVPFTDDEGTIGTPVLVPETGSSSVTVNLPTGRTAPVTVFVALLPNASFSQGFRLRYEYGDGKVHPGYAYVKRDGRAVNRRSILNIKTLDDRIREEYFVKTTGSCSDVDVAGAGNSWDNALNVTGLADLLNQPVDGGGVQINADAYDRAWMLDGATIHIAAGDYDLATAAGSSSLKIEYSKYSRPVSVKIYGSYPSGSSGTSTAVRDTANYVTSFSGGTNKSVLVLGNQTDVLLDGVTVKDMNWSGSPQGAVRVAAGETGTAALKAVSCRFVNNRNDNSNTAAGLICFKGVVDLDKCTFTGNYARNGSSVHVDSDAVVTVTNCKFDGNTTYNTSGALQSAGGTLDVDHCLFVNNQSCVSDTTQYGAGGAYHANGTGVVATFTDCVFSGNEGKLGGAMSLQTATVTCTRCVFEDNVAWKNKGLTATYSGTADKPCGGAACLSSAASRLTLNDCVLRNNSAPYASGGAIAIRNSSSQLTLNEGTTFSENSCWREGGAINSVGQLTMTGTSGSPVAFNHNYTTHDGLAKGNGGALWVGSGSQVALSHVAFADNVAGTGTSNNYSNGGGIYVDAATSFSLSNCTFTGHLARNGGSLYFYPKSSLNHEVTDCSFTSNYCDDNNTYFDGTIGSCNFHGGAVCVAGSKVTFTRCNFTDNKAYNGAGALHINHASSDVNCVDCTFTENAVPSTAWAGAVFVEVAGASFTASGTSFTENSAKIGGAIYSAPNLTLTDCIFDANTATNGAVMHVDGNLTMTGTDTLKCAIRNHAATSVPPIEFGSSSALSFTKCKFENNSVANPAAHGGLFPLGSNTFSATDCVFAGNSVSGTGSKYGVVASLNTASAGSISLTRTVLRNCSGSTNGGAIYLSGGILTASGNSLTIDGCTFKDNVSSGYGGVINSTISTAQTYVIENSVFLRNSCTGAGGAFHGNGGAADRSVTLNGCRFENNSSSSGGGAVNCGKGALTVTDCSFTNNSTVGNGGAIKYPVNDALSELTLSDCRFTDNTSTLHGGALYTSSTAALTLTDCGFSGNSVTADSAFGDAIAYSGSELTLTSAGTDYSKNYIIGHTSTYPIHSPSVTNYTFNYLNFKNNTSSRNGCLINLNNSDNRKFSIANSNIEGNSAPNGGVIYADLKRVSEITAGKGDCTIRNTTIKNNTATDSNSLGGAIYWNCASWNNSHGSPKLQITVGSTLEGNQAGQAGSAIYLNVGRVVLNGCSITDNTFASLTSSEDDAHGGTLYIASTYSKFDITSCTFSGNKVDGKGGVVNINNGRVFMTDCVCNNNSAYSRGGVFFQTGTGFLFVRRSSFSGNRVTKSNAWGNFLHVNNSSQYTILLNSTIDDGGTAARPCINGSPNLMMVNSTLIGNSTNPTVRVESNKNGLLLNSIVFNKGGGDAIFHNGNYNWSSYGGYNILGTVNQNGKTVSNIPGGRTGDQANKTVADMGSWAWNSAGYYTWDGKVGGVATATPAIVIPGRTDYVSDGMANGFNYDISTIKDDKDFTISVTNIGNQVMKDGGWAAGDYYLDQRNDSSADRRVVGSNFPGAYVPLVSAYSAGGAGSYSGDNINTNGHEY